MRFNILPVLGFAASLGFASAQDSGSSLLGNPINLPASDSLVTAGTPFEIKWQPTTTGPVTIHLLKGPPTDLVDLGPIASHIDNTGSYSWTPSNSLQDSATMPEGDKYGLKLVVDATGQYQYSMPFDIKSPQSTYSSASGSGSSSAAGNATSVGATSAAYTTVPAVTATYTSAASATTATAATTVTYAATTLATQASSTGGSTGTQGNVSTTASPSPAATANSAVGKSVGTGLFLATNLLAALLFL